MRRKGQGESEAISAPKPYERDGGQAAPARADERDRGDGGERDRPYGYVPEKKGKFLTWNPWRGCVKRYPGCERCWMHVIARSHGLDPNEIAVSKSAWNEPLAKNRDGSYKIDPGTVLQTCLTTDFFLEEAPDEWRAHVLDIARRRTDVGFSILTKRAHRIKECLPDDWADPETGEPAYRNVELAVTVENQDATSRIEHLIGVPAARKRIMCEPLIGPVDIREYLETGEIDYVLCGGENYRACRICDERWVADLSRQCADAGVPFSFFDSGENFRRKDGQVVQEHYKKKRRELAWNLGYDIDPLGYKELDLRTHPADDIFSGESLF